MNENPTREEVLASIVPKSDQLNADDLLTGPITVTITKVSRGSKEQPIYVEIEGHMPFRPCKSMRRVLIATWGDDPSAWVGQRMTLFCDPAVVFGGIKVGGIRVSHMSGMEAPRNFLLTKSRGKRAEVTIQPLKTEAPKALTAEEQKIIVEATAGIAAADSLDSLANCAKVMQGQSEAVKAAMREPYGKRKAELSEANQDSQEVQDALNDY